MKEEEGVEEGEGGSLSDSSACGGEGEAAAACAHSWMQEWTEKAGLPELVFLSPGPWHYPPHSNNQHMGLQVMIYSSLSICRLKDPAAVESSVTRGLSPAQKQHSRCLWLLQTAAIPPPNELMQTLTYIRSRNEQGGFHFFSVSMYILCFLSSENPNVKIWAKMVLTYKKPTQVPNFNKHWFQC